MADQPVFLFLGVYGDPAVAREDLEVVRDLHASGVIGTYDAAVAVKDADGSVHIDKWEKADLKAQKRLEKRLDMDGNELETKLDEAAKATS